MKRFVISGLLLALASIHADAQVNAGEQKSDPNLPFNMTQVTTLTCLGALRSCLTDGC
jgi:hypothetical protein